MAGCCSPAVPLLTLGWWSEWARLELLCWRSWVWITNGWLLAEAVEQLAFLLSPFKRQTTPPLPPSLNPGLAVLFCLQPCARLTVTDAVKLSMLTCKASSRLHATFSSDEFFASVSDQSHFSSDEPAGSRHLERNTHVMSFLLEKCFKTKQQRPLVLSSFIILHEFSHKDRLQRATLALISLKREWDWTTEGWCGEGEKKVLRI